MNTNIPSQFPGAHSMPPALALKPVSKDDVCLNICKINLAQELKQQINELGNINGLPDLSNQESIDDIRSAIIENQEALAGNYTLATDADRGAIITYLNIVKNAQDSVFIGCWKNTNKLISFVSGPPKHCMRAMTTGCNNIRKNHASSIDRMTELGIRILTLTPWSLVTSMVVGVIYAAAAPQKPNDTTPLKVMAGTYPIVLISLLAMWHLCEDYPND